MSKIKISCYFIGMKRNDSPQHIVTQLPWPGAPGEDIRVRLFCGRHLQEALHTRDHYLFCYALQGSFSAEVQKRGQHILFREGDFYTAQPGSAFALRVDSPSEDVTLAEIRIRKEAFLRDMLPYLTFDERVFRFYLEPANNAAADDYVLQSMDSKETATWILDSMLQEYEEGREGSQSLLKAMALQLFLLGVRSWLRSAPQPEDVSPVGQILHYIEIHSDTVTLEELAAQFHYHPNYISALVHRASGRSFSRLVLEARMARAEMLLKHPELSVEEVAALTGYAGASGFYKAYKGYFGKLPRC